MHEIDERLWEQIYNQTKNISEKGITSNNVDLAYKVIEMYYRLKKLEILEKEGYSDTYGNRGNSYDRKDPYSRDPYSRYVTSKRDYRNTHSNDCKAEMIDTLEMYMNDFVKEMEELARDADCIEERDLINRYIRRIKEL